MERHKASYAVTGGLAARSYGSSRPLNDIDIDVKNEDLPGFFKDIAPYVTYGPDRYRDLKWDLFLVTLNYAGQEIDLGGGSDIRIYDDSAKGWRVIPTDFSDLQQREIFGLVVPVVSARQLIAYKNLLDGDHQKIDMKAASDFLKEL